MRNDGRADEALRPVRVEYGVQPHAEGSVLVKMGNTHVCCAVSVEDRVPPFLQGSDRGWVTAEYAMLPRATHSRHTRERNAGPSGRTQEIQRLIGRSLRMMLDLRAISGHTLRVDCDVLNADGGTRCASITGGALALRQALATMAARGMIASVPELLPVAAVSVVLVQGRFLLDPDYSEDSSADVDANFVMSRDGRWIEAQCTAEEGPFAPEDFQAMAGLASQGIHRLFALWEGRDSA